MKFITYDPSNGKILMSGDLPESMIHLQGEHVLKLDASPISHYIDLATLLPVTKPEKPHGFYVWSDDSKEWAIDLKAAELGVITQRNQLLVETDWTQLGDIPAVTKMKWKEYRQQLRDITDQVEYPLNVIWPDKPE